MKTGENNHETVSVLCGMAQLDLRTRTGYHKQFADFYEELVVVNAKRQRVISPKILSNTVAGSLQIGKIQLYKNKYVDEVKPIADSLYKEKDYVDAVEYYKLIYDIIGVKRTDILIKMAQCYVYNNNMPEAEKFYKLACDGNKRGAYLRANFAIALSSKKANAKRALECIEEAKIIIDEKENLFNWELALIKFAEAKAARYFDIEKAKKLFLEMCDIESTNTYYLCVCADFFYRNNGKEIAKEKYEIAKKIDHNYHGLIYLSEKFDSKADTNLLEEFDESEIESVTEISPTLN